MKKKFIKKAYFWIGTSCLIVVICCKVVIQNITAVTAYTFSIDSRLSEDAHNSLINFCNDHAKKNGHRINICHILKENFPELNNISAHHKVPGKIHINTIIAEPSLLLGSQVLLKNGIIISQHIIEPTLLQDILVVHASPELCNKLTKQEKRFLIQLNKELLQNFTLKLLNNHELYLNDNTDPNFNILTDLKIPLHQKIIDACYYSKNNFIKKNSSSYKLTADIRFKNQVIMIAKKNGGKL